MRASTGLNSQADSLIKYFRRRAKRGNPEARRDWLWTPARVVVGDEDSLDKVIQRAKDRGAETGFELVYVYKRAPVWTCEPSGWVRDLAHKRELQRELGAQERWEATSPPGSYNAALAGATVSTLKAAIQMLNVDETEPVNDPVIARIDAAGIAN